MPKTESNPVPPPRTPKPNPVKQLLAAMRRRRGLTAGIAAAVVVAGAGAAVAVMGLPEWEVVDDLASLTAKPTLAELAKKAKESPKDAGLQRDLGDAQFEAGNRSAGLRAYDRALALEKDAPDRMLENLVDCYGKKEQAQAHAIITRHKLAQIESRLDDLTKSKVWRVRTGAISTLEKLGKASKSDYLNVWTADLQHTECEVRQYAVAKLGELGDKRALDPIRAAKKLEDETNTGWFASKCLGGRADEAEKKILAAR